MVNYCHLCSLLLWLFLIFNSSNGAKFRTTENVNEGNHRTKRQSNSAVTVFDDIHKTMKWNKKSITYKISEYTTQVSMEFADNEIGKAFKLWEDHIDLEFINTKDIGADIDIRFCKGNHGDSAPFQDHDIAHAFPPDEELGGDIHFNDNFTFWSDGTTLLYTATHEIGHAIGLSHMPLNFAVMSPYQGHSAFPVHLALEEIKAVQGLYGRKRTKTSPRLQLTTSERTQSSSTQKPTSVATFVAHRTTAVPELESSTFRVIESSTTTDKIHTSLSTTINLPNPSTTEKLTTTTTIPNIPSTKKITTTTFTPTIPSTSEKMSITTATPTIPSTTKKMITTTPTIPSTTEKIITTTTPSTSEKMTITATTPTISSTTEKTITTTTLSSSEKITNTTTTEQITTTSTTLTITSTSEENTTKTTTPTILSATEKITTRITTTSTAYDWVHATDNDVDGSGDTKITDILDWEVNLGYKKERTSETETQLTLSDNDFVIIEDEKKTYGVESSANVILNSRCKVCILVLAYIISRMEY